MNGVLPAPRCTKTFSFLKTHSMNAVCKEIRTKVAYGGPLSYVIVEYRPNSCSSVRRNRMHSAGHLPPYVLKGWPLSSVHNPIKHEP